MKKFKELKKLFKFTKSLSDNLVKLNIIFVLVFLNIWDYALNRQILNAMMLGIFTFSPIGFLWFIGNFRSIALLTLISVFEFTVLLVLIAQSFELSGLAVGAKSVFWLPFLLMAGINTFSGLKIYSVQRVKHLRSV